MKVAKNRMGKGPDWRLALVGAALAAAGSGCGAFDWAKHTTNAMTGTRAEHPTRILALVSPAELKENGAQVQQGIMCRLYFFAAQNPIPVKVDGDVTITAYDRSKSDRQRPPDGKYEIAAGKLPTHLRKDMVGDSYLFWLPYAPACPTQMSVQARIRDKEGNETVSDIVSVQLEPLTVAQGAPPALSSLERPRTAASAPNRAGAGSAKLATLQAPVAAN